MDFTPKPVVERCPGPGYQDIMRSDNQPINPLLALECLPPHEDTNIALNRYTSREFFDLEMKKVWAKIWQYACRDEHLAEVGDYYVYEIGRHSILITRAEDGLKAYHNSCLHRGTKFKPTDGTGWSPQIQCPFHGWTWNLDGTIKDIPCRWDFTHVEPDAVKLPEVLVESWNGFVFINMDLKAKPLMEYLEVLPDHWKNIDLRDWYIHTHVRKLLPGNWKAAVEVFLEGYHTPTSHPQMSRALADVNMQHDIFSDHITRALSATASPSPTSTRKLSEQELLDCMLVSDRSVVGDSLTVPEGKTARWAMARHLREIMAGGSLGEEIQALNDAEILDPMNYNIFPNLFISPTVSLPMIQQIRPLPDNPDYSYFDQMMLRPKPADGSDPPIAEVISIGENDSWTTAEGLDLFFANVLDQDTEIVRAQRQGMYASATGEQILSRYQEARARHLHDMIDKYLRAS